MLLLKEREGKLIQELKELIYSRKYPITQYRMLKTEKRFEPAESINTDSWELMTNRQLWGGHNETYYFETVITVPKECQGKTLTYELRTGREGEWDALNPQFLAYVNGHIVQGLDVNHREILLTEQAKAGEQYRILLSAYTGDQNFSLFLDSEYKILEREVEHYYYDISVPYEVARLLPSDSQEYMEIIQCLNESLNLLDLRKKYSLEFYDSLARAQEYITEEFYKKRCSKAKETVCCVGHTHIDCAWLWTLKTTRDKAVRSFSTVLELMKRYPEYKFMSSQPQLYDYVKKHAPEIYVQIKERVAEGRWEPEGGMWVEADCNIASGESLIRQFLHGLRFFEEEFQTKNEILWLPDVFGYSAALPQIMKKCGIHYFMTTKISWNEFDKMPYDTFLWEGIDGTKVLTHFSPSRDYGKGAIEGSAETEHFTTYNAMLNPSQVKGNWQRYSQKELHTDTLMSFGYGDGGGGPTAEMLENCKRLEQGIPGSPRAKQSHALEFFQNLEKTVTGNRYLPKWVGELYLEYHRGTYTSMARNKKFNRQSEFACENLEFYSVLAKTLFQHPYPQKELTELWEIVLRNQFHDILPGSSILEVYQDSWKEYEHVLSLTEQMTKKLLQEVANRVDAGENEIVLFNPNHAGGPAPVLIPHACFAKDSGMFALSDGHREYPLQETAEGYLAVLDEIPVRGYGTYRTVAKEFPEHRMVHSLQEIDTPYFHIVLNQAGQFTSIYDKVKKREIIPDGTIANQIITYEDKPHNFDAWDINNYYTEKSWEVNEVSSAKILENGPIRACIRIERPYLDSKIVQYLYFYQDLYRIDIRNEIDWKEEQILVRDYFPVDIHTDEAVFEIQYGNVKRATHSNTMWDFAKFEVCAHKWLDVSENGYGVSILNDCKYGCSVKDGIIGLTMLKSPLYPNPEADKEHHTFWYSICPHEDDFRAGHTVEKAYLFNNPLTAVLKQNAGGSLPKKYSYVTVQEQNVVIETVKQAERSEHTVIRLYECYNRRCDITLTVDADFTEAWESDLLEHPETKLKTDGTTIYARIKPYEIKTIILK
ncbi:MAG: alpha-mannosidase [Lachnospiraceae bacterium]|jgi:alpha-mannosidase|nr:alpha-mannosidase [Lachnospiraceae bacterium]